MMSERSIRSLACRWCLAAVLALLACLLAPSRAQAQVQTFFVNVPAASEQRDAMEVCRDRFTAALVRVGGFRANQDAVTQQSVTDCLGETASATAKRECEVSMANIEVDFLILPTVRRLGEQWNWSIKALSPAQGAAQVWGGDGSSVEADAAKAAYGACESLAKDFACEQGVERACSGSGFGGGPLLGADAAGTTGEGTPRAAPRRVNVSALDVFDVVPTEVAVWIDGKESGTSANQVTGIPPGEHEVTLKATGYFDDSQRITFVAGKAAVVQGVRLKKTTSSLVVTMAEPSEATVLVGGRERGRSGTSLAGIAPGATEVLIRAPGYRDRRAQVAFVADEEARVERVVLESLPAIVTVTANIMGASVLVDGQVVGETTGEDDAFEVSHTSKLLELRRDGYRPFSQSLTLQRGGHVQVRVTMARTAAPPAPKPVAGPPRSVPGAVVAPPVASAKQGGSGSGPAWLLWTGLAAGLGATSGMAAVCGGFAACKVESNNDAATVDALRIAAFGGFSLAATGLLWSWFSDGSSSAEQVQKESGRLQVGIGLGQVQMEVAW
jgi:hypothetical protein